MRRNFMMCAAGALTLIAAAQSFTVYKTNGDRIGFNNVNVERIEFSENSLGSSTDEYHTIDFNEHLQSISPEEGIVDLTVNPLGLGRISIGMEGSYQENFDSTDEIVLANTSGVIFSKRATDPGMNVYRNIIGGTTEFLFTFDANGMITPGIYHLYIPEGVYIDRNTSNPLSATTRVFLIQNPPKDQSYNVTPAEGVVEKLNSITFSFANYGVVEMVPTAKAYVMKEGSSMPEAMPVPTLGVDGTVTVSFPEITSPGIYTINIPASTLLLREEEGGKAYENEELNFVYVIEGATQAAPRVGDFYYSDGSWSSTLIKREGVSPIGVIYYLGVATEGADNVAYYTQKDGKTPMSEFHGYVVALRDATEDGNGNNDGVVWHKFDGDDPGVGCSVNTTNHLGYSNTKSARAYAEKNYGGLSASAESLPAVYYATDHFESEVPAPAQSSGWFLPSAGQLKYIFDKVYFDPNSGDPNAAFIQKSLKALAQVGGKEMYVRDSSYWTSTESQDAYGKSYRAVYADFDESHIKPGATPWYNKNGQFRVRAVLAF